MAKMRELVGLGLYYKTSREMLWHLLSMINDFCAKDDLMSHSKKELCDLIVELNDHICDQLDHSEQ